MFRAIFSLIIKSILTVITVSGFIHVCRCRLKLQDQVDLQFHPDPARKLSINLYNIYHCCVYSEKPLMMDRATVRNM
jgi:hypothetical protein